MGMNALLTAATKLKAVKERIDALKSEKQRLQDQLAAKNAELASARADSEALILEVKAEAADVVTP